MTIDSRTIEEIVYKICPLASHKCRDAKDGKIFYRRCQGNYESCNIYAAKNSEKSHEARTEGVLI